MKVKIIITGLLLVSFTVFYACNGSGSDENSESDTTITTLEKKMDNLESGDSTAKGGKLGKEYTAKYICPDHCKGSGSDKPGTCANCGMELIENTAATTK